MGTTDRGAEMGSGLVLAHFSKSISNRCKPNPTSSVLKVRFSKKDVGSHVALQIFQYINK